MAEGRILLVEDNPVNRRLAEFLLKSEGFTVYEAATGEEALQIARAEQPDLILMDLQLPGLDGYAATRVLKSDAATRDIAIVALTAFAMTGDRERALEAGCDGYITKPVDTKEFPRVVRRYLASAPRARASGGTSPDSPRSDGPSRPTT